MIMEWDRSKSLTANQIADYFEFQAGYGPTRVSREKWEKQSPDYHFRRGRATALKDAAWFIREYGEKSRV